MLVKKDGIIYSYKDAVAHVVSTGIQSPSSDLSIYGFEPYTPEPPPPPAVIIVAVTARQARLALNAAGLLDDIDAALATMPRDAQIEWQHTHEIRRDSPLIAVVASGLGLDKAAIDELFTQASKL
jgi:hypothetical protein